MAESGDSPKSGEAVLHDGVWWMQAADGSWLIWDAEAMQWTPWRPPAGWGPTSYEQQPEPIPALPQGPLTRQLAPPFIGTRWFRVAALFSLVGGGVALWLVLTDDFLGSWAKSTYVLVYIGWIAVAAIWLRTGKTIRMLVGEHLGARHPSIAVTSSADENRYFRSRADARWFLLGATSFLLWPWGMTLVIALELAVGWMIFFLAIPAIVVGIHQWLFWPAWLPEENDGAWTRAIRATSWSIGQGWSPRSWRQAFGFAGLPVGLSRVARVTYFILLGTGMLAAFVAAEADNPEMYRTAEALVQDLEAAGPDWVCEYGSNQIPGYVRPERESDVADCTRPGARMRVHIFLAHKVGLVREPKLPEADPPFTWWIYGDDWIVETNNRATAHAIAETTRGGVSDEYP